MSDKNEITYESLKEEQKAFVQRQRRLLSEVTEKTGRALSPQRKNNPFASRYDAMD